MAEEDDVVKGGPGDDNPADEGKGTTGKGSKAAGPKMVDLGGVQVPEEMAAYLGPLVSGFSSEITKLRGELAEAKSSKGKTKEAEATSEDFDYETELFANPKEAVKRLKEELRREIIGEVDVKQNTAAMEKEFWQMFYADNPDLKDDDFIVKAVLARDFAKLAPLTNSDAMKKIAEETKKVLLKNRGKSDSTKGVVLEGGGGGGGKGGKFEDVVKPAQVSITQLLKERRMARSKSA